VPELPEVETVVRDLRPHLAGRRIIGARSGTKALRGGFPAGGTKHIIGRTITTVRRRGKWIIMDLDRGQLVVHLGMTGRLTTGCADRPVETHTHFVADLDDEGQLRFRDTRRFGSVTVYSENGAAESYLSERLGPEPCDLGRSEFRRALAATARSVKAVLLDQRIVAGVGNIYADEALFEARLAPAQLGRATTPAEAERLRKAIVRVITRAIECRGSTIRDYVDGHGGEGSFQDEFRAYGRTGEPCVRCRTPIARIRLAGRSTHYCPKCQRSRKKVAPRAAARGLVRKLMQN
jgi:formamidopyrimidine-DNA glycosylase